MASEHTKDAAPDEPPNEFDARRRALGVSTQELWIRCLGLGSDLSLTELREQLAGKRPIVDGDASVLDQALTEAAMDQERLGCAEPAPGNVDQVDASSSGMVIVASGQFQPATSG